MYTIALAFELRETNLKVNAVSPPSTATDFNHHLGTSSVEVGALFRGKSNWVLYP
ncbi:hypothetical protein [Dyadobacter sp. 32]|uniref:hypothetical protein n=1 Tax=Dyadobacter sp. 32 TaxID=538966 RepID=UPI0039C627BC